MSRRYPAPAWCGALASCALAGWFAFVRNTRVPVLSAVDLGFHELGHLIMYVIPINQVLTAAMGSIMQCAVPAGLAAYFWFSRRDSLSADVCLAWCATNFQDASVYIADAPYQRLQLIGGEHDWAFVLGPEHFNRLHDAHTIASIVRGVGMLVLCAAIVIAVRGLLFNGSRSATADRHVATGARSDDLFPSTSRTQS